MMNSTEVKVDVAQVIGQAAQSTLGVLSLICLIVGVIAYAFFKDAGERVKLLVFALLLIAAGGFAAAVLIKANEAKPAGQQPAVPAGQPADGNSSTVEASPAPPPTTSDDVADIQTAVYVERITDAGEEAATCAQHRGRSNLVSGVLTSPFDVAPLDSDCRVKLRFRVFENGGFGAPFQITIFETDKLESKTQVLTATVNKLPGRFTIDVGRVDPTKFLQIYVYRPNASGADTEKEAPTVMGTVDVEVGRSKG